MTTILNAIAAAATAHFYKSIAESEMQSISLVIQEAASTGKTQVDIEFNPLGFGGGHFTHLTTLALLKDYGYDVKVSRTCITVDWSSVKVARWYLCPTQIRLSGRFSDAGYTAHVKGVVLEDCPFGANLEDSDVREWRAGWLKAATEAIG